MFTYESWKTGFICNRGPPKWILIPGNNYKELLSALIHATPKSSEIFTGKNHPGLSETVTISSSMHLL